MENGDLPMKNGDLPMKNGDLPYEKMVIFYRHAIVYICLYGLGSSSENGGVLLDVVVYFMEILIKIWVMTGGSPILGHFQSLVQYDCCKVVPHS